MSLPASEPTFTTQQPDHGPAEEAGRPRGREPAGRPKLTGGPPGLDEVVQLTVGEVLAAVAEELRKAKSGSPSRTNDTPCWTMGVIIDHMDRDAHRGILARTVKPSSSFGGRHEFSAEPGNAFSCPQARPRHDVWRGHR